MAWHISILYDDLLVAYGLLQLHLVNIRIKKLQMVISFDRKVGYKMKVAWNEARHICILFEDMPLVYGLWQLHLVNIRIKKNFIWLLKNIKWS